MAYRGYHFFIGGLELPYAPSNVKVTIGSKNQTVDLIDGNEINVLKNPALTEIEFDVELPRGRHYAFANSLVSSTTYTELFKALMTNKKPTELVITRPNPIVKKSNSGSKKPKNSKQKKNGTSNQFESTVFRVTLEGYTLEEDADNAFDITASLKFKEYLDYGTVKKTVVNEGNGSGGSKTTVEKETKKVTDPKTHTVVKGDTLCKISKKYYGTSDKWKTIYNANKKVIEDAAKKHGKSSSSNGHWIYPGTKLTIPASK